MYVFMCFITSTIEVLLLRKIPVHNNNVFLLQQVPDPQRQYFKETE